MTAQSVAILTVHAAPIYAAVGLAMALGTLAVVALVARLGAVRPPLPAT